MITIACRQCGQQFATYPSNVKAGKKYCSRQCQNNSRKNTADRFWRNVAISGPDECWEWQAHKTTNGYGASRWNSRPRSAHRIALSLTDGLWNDKRFVCHACDNKPCCNPKHLWRGTPLENQRDMIAKGRQVIAPNKGDTHKSAKLRTPQVIEIRTSVLPAKELAEHYGVSVRQIYTIKQHLSWRHIP